MLTVINTVEIVSAIFVILLIIKIIVEANEWM